MCVCVCTSTQEPSLITVKAILILDNDGKRIICKVRGGTHQYSVIPRPSMATTEACFQFLNCGVWAGEAWWRVWEQDYKII